MNPTVENHLKWVQSTLEDVRSNYPAPCAKAALLSVTDRVYLFADAESSKIDSTEELEAVSALIKESRYLALMLGSQWFDRETNGVFALTTDPCDDSLFGIGMGWLPLAIMLGCEMDASIDNANHIGRFSCLIPSINYTFSLGSAAASILSLNDIMLMAIKQIESDATCDTEALVDYLNKVSVSGWEFALAEAGESLLLAEGF